MAPARGHLRAAARARPRAIYLAALPEFGRDSIPAPTPPARVANHVGPSTFCNVRAPLSTSRKKKPPSPKPGAKALKKTDERLRPMSLHPLDFDAVMAGFLILEIPNNDAEINS